MTGATLVRRALLHRRGPTAVALAALAIAAGLAACLLALRLDIRAGLERELAAYGPNLVVHARDGLGAGPLQALRREAPGAAPFAFRVASAGSQVLLAAATPMEETRTLHPYWRVEGRWPATGEALLGVRAAEKLQVEPEGMLDLSFPGTGLPPARLRISGLLSTGGPEDGQVVAAPADLPLGDPTVAVARVPGPPEAVAAAADRLARSGLQAQVIRRVAAADAGLLSRIEALLGWLGLGIAATCMLCAGAQLGSLAWQRRSEVALMRALGAGPRHLARQFMGEAAVLGLLGGAVGSLAGMALAAWMARALFGVDLHLRPAVVPVALLVGTAMAVAAQGIPLSRALRAEPATLLRGD